MFKKIAIAENVNIIVKIAYITKFKINRRVRNIATHIDRQ